jgi:hypothetical protein
MDPVVDTMRLPTENPPVFISHDNRDTNLAEVFARILRLFLLARERTKTVHIKIATVKQLPGSGTAAESRKTGSLTGVCVESRPTMPVSVTVLMKSSVTELGLGFRCWVPATRRRRAPG